MVGCYFCQAYPSGRTRGVEAYIACTLSDGLPCLPCQEYLSLETQIAAVKKTLENMLARQREVCTRINDHHDPITLRLPREIISTIFQHTLFEDFSELGSTPDYLDRKLRSGPLVLGSVCRSWRRIAWSSPRLWTIIRIYLHLHPKDTDPVEVARDWLARSRQLPLSIRISSWAGNGFKPDKTNIGTQLITLVNSHASRWHELEVDALNWAILQLYDGLRNAPHLHTLRTRCSDDYVEKSVVDSPAFRPINVAMSRHTIASYGLDWSYVTHVSAAFFCEDDCLELFRRATRLAHCELVFITESRYGPTQPIVCPSLRSFKIDGLGATDFEEDISLVFGESIVANIVLPYLDHLEAHCLHLDDLDELLSRSSCPLKTLAITDSYFDQTFMLSLLRKTPSLEKMTLMSLSPSDHPSSARNIYVREICQETPNPECADTSRDPKSTLDEEYSRNLRSIEIVNVMDEHEYNQFWSIIPGTWNSSKV